jgi:hypothetical protein
MAHYYDREYDLKEMKERAHKKIDFYKVETTKINQFLKETNLHSIDIPEPISRHIDNILSNFGHYVANENTWIGKANLMLSLGKRYLDFDDYHEHFK